jgi:Amidohydrolase family/IPT/TIG domain
MLPRNNFVSASARQQRGFDPYVARIEITLGKEGNLMGKLPSILVLVALLILALPRYQGLTQESAPTVLTGATLIDGTGKGAIPDAVIVIEDGKFTSVGGRGTKYPANATVINVAGKFIMPGLVDSHTHSRPWCGELYLNHGVTSVFILNPWGTNGNTVESVRASQQSGTRSPRIFGNADRFPLSPTMTQEQVREQFRSWIAKKPDFAVLPSYSERNKQAYQWAAELMHEAGLFVFGHTEDAPASNRAGQDGIEHMWGYAQALMTAEERHGFQTGKHLHWGSFLKNKERIDQMIKESVARGAYLNPTLVYELGSQSNLARKHENDIYDVYRNGALMTYYPRNLADSVLLKFRAVRIFSSRYENPVPLANLAPKDLQEFKEAFRLSQEFTKRWVDLGGKIIGGTDDPSVGTCGLSVHMEMAMLVEAGLTPMQALQAMTLWGAEMLTARKKSPAKPPIGFIGEGANADLVVLTANPLANIENTRKIERVMKGGRFVELGYTPHYVARGEAGGAIPSTPAPELSAITPNTVAEGASAFEITVEGVGFVTNSIVRVDDAPVPTTFVDIRTLKARVPASVVARATPHRFNYPGPEQHPGIYGDRTVKITVFNGPPDGGTSNHIALRVFAKWLAEEKKLGN